MCDRKQPLILVTCEHAGNEIPVELVDCFSAPDAQRQLRSHRGYDPGARLMAQNLARVLNAQLLVSTVSRLVVELNRSLDSPQLFSPFTRGLAPARKHDILRRYYQPHRREVRDLIATRHGQGESVLHLSIHSFTPRFRGTKRAFDMGVLFDPSRTFESKISACILKQLQQDKFRAEANQPYLGVEDGLTTYLRSEFSDNVYAGLEIELNNRIARLSARTQQRWCEGLGSSIMHSLASVSPSL